MNHLLKHGTELIDKGYQIVPIAHKKKYPPIKEWQKTKATASDVQVWADAGHTGVGVLCKNTPAVDLDIRDKSLTIYMRDRVWEICGKGPLRVGMAPKAILPFKTLKPFRKLSSKLFVDPNDPWEKDSEGNPIQHAKTKVPVYRTHQVEILGDGEQFVAYGIHPDTEQPYKWLHPLVETSWDNLPTLGRTQGCEIVDTFESRCTQLGFKLVKKNGTKEQHLVDPPEVRPAEQSAEPSSLFPEDQKGEVGVGKDAAAPYLTFEEFDKANSADPGRLQIEDYVVKGVLKDVDPTSLDYQGWMKVGMALYHQFGGDEKGYDLWEEWSASDAARFEPDEMPEKWKTFKTEPGRVPVTFRTVLKQAEKTRKKRDILQEYIDRYVYIESEDTVHDLYGPPHKSSPALKNFRVRTAPDEMECLVPAPLKDDPTRELPKTFPVSALWLKHSDRKWASGEIYRPNNGEGSRLVELGGYQYLNTFRMPSFPKPTGVSIQGNRFPEAITPFLEHMSYLFPIREEREWFISWMALNIQHPDRRCKVTPLHISLHHGTGRGWLVSLLGKLLGGWNCTKTKMHDIVEGAWGNYLDRSLLCCVEEVHEGGHAYEVSEALRDILTEDTLQLNVKYGGIETKRVFTNFFFMSNRADALVLKDEDRRINVFRMDSEPRDSGYYKDLYAWSKGKGEGTDEEVPTDGVCALWHWLAERDLSDFNWQTSLKSDSRAALIGNTQNNVEARFREVLAGCPGKVITVKKIKQIMGQMAEAEGDDPFIFESSKVDRQLTKMLQQSGWLAGGLVKVGGVSHRIWTSRGVTAKSTEFVRNEVEKMVDWKI